MKLRLYEKAPLIGSKINEIAGDRGRFSELGLEEQVFALIQLNKIMSCNAECGNLSSFVDGASQVGKIFKSGKVSSWESAKLILQSTTGLYEKEIDLKTVQPGEI